MSYVFIDEADLTTPTDNLVGWGWIGISLLLVTKALDATSTAVGLLYVPGFVEANPFAAAAFGSLGVVTGLVVLSSLTVLIVGSVTELGARYLERHDEAPGWGAKATRVVGYGPISIVFATAALHNTGLIVQVLLLG